MAEVLGVSCSGYYRFRGRLPSNREQKNAVLLSKIRGIFEQKRKTYGSPRIDKELKCLGESCSRPRVARLMRKAGLRAVVSRRFKTTISAAGAEAAPNRLEQNFSAPGPNLKWVSDISYIRTAEGFLYLAVVIDLFSRKVIGMSMGISLHTRLVLDALHQALQRRQPGTTLQYHSDRGCQYTSDAFQSTLKRHGILPSMSGKGCCFDNAVAESFFHTLKTECVYRHSYQTREEARQSIFEYVEIFYNNERRHSTLGYVSPAEFERCHLQQRLSS